MVAHTRDPSDLGGRTLILLRQEDQKVEASLCSSVRRSATWQDPGLEIKGTRDIAQW